MKREKRIKKRRNLRRARKVMGIHACMETLKVRPKKIRSIYVQKGWKQQKQIKWIVEQAQRYRIDLIEHTKQQMAGWGYGHQGTALVVEESPQLNLSKNKKSVLIYIDGLEDPRNLGAVLRTAWLMGGQGIFLPERNSIHYLTSAVAKTASGGAEHIPVEFLSRPSHWIQKIKEEGYWVYGLDKKSSCSLLEEEFGDQVVLAVGSEGKGLKPRTKLLCDRMVSIPQMSAEGNYNLSVAVALGLSRVIFKH